MEQGVGLRYPKEKMNKKHVCHGDIEYLWTRLHSKFDLSRQKIGLCKEVREGKELFSLPPEWSVPGTENLTISTPQKIVVPLKTINVLGRKQPRLKRYPVGNGINSGLVAGNIETWVNAAIEKKINWGELIGKLFLDGECAVVVVPSYADWEYSPDFMDSLTDEEFSLLDEETQSRYCPMDEYDEPMLEEMPSSVKKYIRIDENGKPMPDSRYWRDSYRSPDYPYGRTQDDPYYVDNPRRRFKEDRNNTKKAFEEEQAHWLTEELPFDISVVSASNCYPVFGKNNKLEGLVIKRSFSSETLLGHGYIWDQEGDLLTPEEDNEGEVTLYEYWGTDTDGSPYVSYSVNGVTTHFKTWSGDKEVLADAVIDLRKEFGLRKLPIQYYYGLHFETDDVKTKGVPFLWPILGSITGVEALATTILVHSYSTAFGAWGVQVDPQILRDFPGLLVEGTKPRTFVATPLAITMLPGKPYPLVHPGVGKDVKDLLRMFQESIGTMIGSDIAFGASGATSGHDRALSREYLETSMNQVLDGALQAYRFIGERIIEICCNITKRTNVKIPVYATVPVPQTVGKKNRSPEERQIINLDPKWVGPIYNLEAWYPKQPGENMAELQQLSQLYLQGLITFREFREKGFGDENPSATLIEIFTDQYLKTDAGKAEVAQIAAEMMGADAEEEKQRLIEQKRLTPGGTPLAALPPELQALNTGQIPPGVDPELFLTKLQGMLAHDAARKALGGEGPFGSGVSPAALATGVQAPGGAAIVPPAMTPPGAPGPAGPASPGMNAEAPTLAGMSVPSAITSAVGGQIAGEMGTASQLRDSAARAGIGG